MPKTISPRTPASRLNPVLNVATKVLQRKANSARIRELLHEIRRAAGLPMSFRRLVVNPGEYCANKQDIFIGDSDNVNSSNHPRFSELGQLYRKVCVDKTSYLSIHLMLFARYIALTLPSLYDSHGIPSRFPGIFLNRIRN